MAAETPKVGKRKTKIAAQNPLTEERDAMMIRNPVRGSWQENAMTRTACMIILKFASFLTQPRDAAKEMLAVLPTSLKRSLVLPALGKIGEEVPE